MFRKQYNIELLRYIDVQLCYCKNLSAEHALLWRDCWKVVQC